MSYQKLYLRSDRIKKNRQNNGFVHTVWLSLTNEDHWYLEPIHQWAYRLAFSDFSLWCLASLNVNSPIEINGTHFASDDFNTDAHCE